MLRVGVSVAARRHSAEAASCICGTRAVRHRDYTHFHAAPAEALSIRGTLAGVAHGSDLSIIQLGVLLLIATPIVRVVFALVGFARASVTPPVHLGQRSGTWRSWSSACCTAGRAID